MKFIFISRELIIDWIRFGWDWRGILGLGPRLIGLLMGWNSMGLEGGAGLILLGFLLVLSSGSLCNNLFLTLIVGIILFY